MKTSITILGTEYTLVRLAYDEDPTFKKRGCDGYIDEFTKSIVYGVLDTFPAWADNDNQIAKKKATNEILRHEIVHAFLTESGLKDSATSFDGPWSRNEEMVDWYAIQAPKIHAAFVELDIL